MSAPLTEHEPMVRQRRHNFIDGQWSTPSRADVIDVENPCTTSIIGCAPSATAADIDMAIDAAHRARRGWAATPADERAAFIDRIREGIEERLEEFATTWTQEVGIPITTARAATGGLPISGLRAIADIARTMPWQEQMSNSRIVHDPIGVVAAITPWNYPLSQIATKTAAALAAGCTVVAKPSEVAPLCAYAFADVVAAAGLPAGVFNLVGGTGIDAGEPLITDARVGAISFTGSTATGRRVMTAAAANITRVCLELGGKSAAVVLDEEILATAIQASIASCLRNSGQTCTSLTRLIVPQHLAAAATELAAELFSAAVVGDPMDERTTIGPLVSAAQRDRVLGYIRKGVESGARLVVGGAGPITDLPGWFVAPTVFADVDPSSVIAQEEIFGPVLSIITVADRAEAIAVANGVDYGLAGSVWASDPDEAVEVAMQIEAGSITVNGGVFNTEAPYGGLKQSGIGYELGRAGIEEFLTTRVLHLV